MEYKPNLLVTQSFVVSGPGTYWDYRDYIFCMCSNSAIRNSTFRLNIERGQEFVGEFREAANAHGFSDTRVTTEIPESWAGYMLKQIDSNPTYWVMPWPGDHIYINPDDLAFTKALQKGEELNADAVLYGHMQDFEYFLDWDRINVLYNDANYVMIEWGWRHRYRQNKKLRTQTKKLMQRDFYMIPVPAFVVYKRQIFKEILKALPKNTKRWQDMESSPAKSTWSFKLLIPKQCLYRHVHGYWLEGFFKHQSSGVFPQDAKAELESWYVRTNYDWKSNSPSRLEYKDACLKEWPYFIKYLKQRTLTDGANEFGSTPFDPAWQPAKDFKTRISSAFQNHFIEPIKLLLSLGARLIRSRLRAIRT